MDEDSKLNPDNENQDQEQQSPFDQAGNVSEKTKDLGQKAYNVLKGSNAAGATEAEAGAAATESATGAGASAAAATATETQAAVAGAELATVAEAGTTTLTTGASIGPWAAVGIILLVVFMTFAVAIMQGGPNANAGTPTTPPVVEPPPGGNSADCSELNIAGLTCIIDAPSQVNNGQKYTYLIDGNFTPQSGGRTLDSYKIILKIPNSIVLSNIPGKFTVVGSASGVTYTWLLSDPKNLEIIDPTTGDFHLHIDATPQKDDTTVSVEFLIE